MIDPKVNLDNFPELKKEQTLEEEMDAIKLPSLLMDAIQSKAFFLYEHGYSNGLSIEQLIHNMVKVEKQKIINQRKENGK